MKNLGSAILIGLMMCITLNSAYAQSSKVNYKGSFHATMELPCLNEVVTGEVYYEGVVLNGLTREHLWGTMIGETTMNEYTFDQRWIIVKKNPSKNSTTNTRIKIRMGGELVASMRAHVHYTIVRGELKVDHNLSVEDCK